MRALTAPACTLYILLGLIATEGQFYGQTASPETGGDCLSAK